MKRDAGSGRHNHYLPRTRNGRIAVGLFLLVFLFAEPPLVYWIGNRIEPFILGMPFLFAYLGLIYFVLIGILIWARRRGV